MVYQYVLPFWWFISMFSKFVDGLSVCFPNLLMVCRYFPPSFDGLSWCLPKLVGGFRYIPLWHFTTHVVFLVGVYPVLVSPRFEHRWIGLWLTTMGVQSTTVLVLCAANNHGKLRDFFMISSWFFYGYDKQPRCQCDLQIWRSGQLLLIRMAFQAQMNGKNGFLMSTWRSRRRKNTWTISIHECKRELVRSDFPTNIYI